MWLPVFTHFFLYCWNFWNCWPASNVPQSSVQGCGLIMPEIIVGLNPRFTVIIHHFRLSSCIEQTCCDVTWRLFKVALNHTFPTDVREYCLLPIVSIRHFVLQALPFSSAYWSYQWWHQSVGWVWRRPQKWWTPQNTSRPQSCSPPLAEHQSGSIKLSVRQNPAKRPLFHIWLLFLIKQTNK